MEVAALLKTCTGADSLCPLSDCATQKIERVKDISKFRDQFSWLDTRLGFLKAYLPDMVTLHKPTRRAAWQDQDHWLARAAFGVCLVALAVWLLVLYLGYAVGS